MTSPFDAVFQTLEGLAWATLTGTWQRPSGTDDAGVILLKRGPVGSVGGNPLEITQPASFEARSSQFTSAPARGDKFTDSNGKTWDCHEVEDLLTGSYRLDLGHAQDT